MFDFILEVSGGTVEALCPDCDQIIEGDVVLIPTLEILTACLSLLMVELSMLSPTASLYASALLDELTELAE